MKTLAIAALFVALASAKVFDHPHDIGFVKHWGGRFEMDCETGEMKQTIIRVGERIPDVTLSTMELGTADRVSTIDLLEDQRVIMFSVSGAWQPESVENLKEYLRHSRKMIDNDGVDAVVVVTTDEPYTIEGRLHSSYFNDVPHIGILTMFSDGNGELAKAMGMVHDRRPEGYGLRWRCMSAIVDDGVLVALNVDEGHVHEHTHLAKLKQQLHDLPPYVHKYHDD